MAETSLAALIAVAVEEGDGERGGVQPVVVGGDAEGRDRQRQHQQHAAGAKRGRFREQLDQRAPPAGYVEAVHEGGKALVALARLPGAAEQGKVDPGIEPEKEPPQIRAPILWEQVAQGYLPCRSAGGSRREKGILPDPRPSGQYSEEANVREGEREFG